MSVSLQKVGVLGGGSWGTTLAHLLGANGNKTLLWLRDEAIRDQINTEHVNGHYLPDLRMSENVHATTDLEEVCRQCYLIVCVVPSHAMRTVAADMGEFVGGDQVVIHATKGLEADVEHMSFKRMSEILREETCLLKVGVLSGPNLAKEIMQGQPAATVE